MTLEAKLTSNSTMIVEGLVTSLNAQGEVNVAPMGPIVDEQMTQLILRPFQTSTTYRNLKAKPFGVFHITDDVLLIAQAALDRLDVVPTTIDAEQVSGKVLADCCRWYEFEIVQFNDASERTELTARVVHTGWRRDMAGFNRARHAVLEATIVATRLHLISEEDVRRQLSALESPVNKTAGPRERAAFELVVDYIDEWYRRHGADRSDH